MSGLTGLSAASIAQGALKGDFTAAAVVSETLQKLEKSNPILNCFTAIFAEEAMTAALDIDKRLARGEVVGPLAGVPFSVKNLFNINGKVTVAGSKILRDRRPADADAVLVARMKAAGAILVGANTMDEFAYGFTTENAHDGTCRNPHNVEHVAGGSSGGSAAAVAAGLVPISLGSDTNGSIRVPAAFCGIYGLKPTYGRLPRTGSYPFVPSLDHLGPLSRCIEDLVLSYNVLQGYDAGDTACVMRPAEMVSVTSTSIADLRVAVLGGWFHENASPEALQALDVITSALGSKARVEMPEAERARAAAFCITAAEGANLHLDHLKTRAADFDPSTLDRLLAGALLPATIVQQAQRFRRWFQTQVSELFRHYDILLAPTTPGYAPKIGQETVRIGNCDVPTRANIGLFTQPISFIGLPVVAAPVAVRERQLPLGIQIIASPFQEARALQVAAFLESQNVLAAPVAAAFAE